MTPRSIWCPSWSTAASTAPATSAASTTSAASPPRSRKKVVHRSLFHDGTLSCVVPAESKLPRSSLPSLVVLIIDIKEFCCEVVNPITNETITQYKKLQQDPTLKNIWIPAMSKEIHRLAQDKEGITPDTETLFSSYPTVIYAVAVAVAAAVAIDAMVLNLD